MLQQFRQLFDHLVYGQVEKAAYDTDATSGRVHQAEGLVKTTDLTPSAGAAAVPVKSFTLVEVPANSPPPPQTSLSAELLDVQGPWQQEMAAAGAKLAPEGSLTGATRELQAGLG